MKHKLLYLLPVLLAFGTGCGPSKSNVSPVNIPVGTFTGQFRLLHKKAGAAKFDTTKTNLVLTMVDPGFTYAVTGDTATVHAGSKGTFAISSQYIVFNDSTFPKTVTPTKTHLQGGYLYYYDGNVFQMLAYSADTLALQYDLKKSQ